MNRVWIVIRGTGTDGAEIDSAWTTEAGAGVRADAIKKDAIAEACARGEWWPDGAGSAERISVVAIDVDKASDANREERWP